jgi:LytTr DNA-binding domain
MPPISAPTTGVSKIDHDGARIEPLFAGFESGSGRHGFSVFHRRERYARPYPRYNRENYVSLHVKNDVWLVRETAGEFARRYAAFGIRRIHRSTLVNVDRIVELRPLDNGEYTLVLRDGSQLKLSRSYRNALSDLLSNNP